MEHLTTKQDLGTTPPQLSLREKFLETFPSAVRDGVLDVESIATLLGVEIAQVREGKESFGLSWAGKAQAAQAMQAPSFAALRPDFDASINWNTAKNVFIEGDNLEVLKLLQSAYNDKIKMIYIDPPYNTGNDFVYNDDFSDSKKRYLEVTGQVDSDGNRLSTNTETSGRKHSNWLSMMYPRLSLARNLLTEDGSIFVSIDDNEVHNLRQVMDSIFGEENFVGQFVWAAGRKNDSRFISSSHEYILVFARNLSYLVESGAHWKLRKEGLDEIYAASKRIWAAAAGDEELATKQLRAWFKELPESNPAKSHKHYANLDAQGPFFPSDSGAPDKPETRSHRPLIHPVTGQPTAVPSKGWRWKDSTLDELVSKGRIVFGADHRTVPKYKGYLSEREYESPYSVFYTDGRGASSRLKTMLGGSFFDFPKDELVLQRLVQLATDTDSIVLDFFAGSGTTGHAVELQNQLDGGSRTYICVTLDEPTPDKSEARSAGFLKVSQITEARLKKVAELSSGAMERGMRVFRLGPSSFEPFFPEESGLFNLVETSKSQTFEKDAAAAEVLLKQGVGLDEQWFRELGVRSGSVLFVDGDDVARVETSTLPEPVSTVVVPEDAFIGRDDLKAKLHFDLKQRNKRLVTY